MTTEQPSENCLWTARIQDTNTNNYYCIPCFITSHIENTQSPQNPIVVASLSIIHCFAKGPYIPYYCFNCNRSCTKVQPINQCSLCVIKYFELIANLGLQGIDTTNAQFQYDIINDTLITFNSEIQL